MIRLLVGLILTALGIAATAFTRAAAIPKEAPTADKMVFALSLILTLIGIVIAITGFMSEHKKVNIRTLATAALFAALCYVGFSYCRIDIPVGTEKTAFHLGNVFCVLAALFIGGFWGGMAGAVGMTIADLTTAYVTSAPKTFLLKLCIGLITGFIAHKIFKISQEKENRKVPVAAAAAVSCVGGMLFNVIADPVVGFFYKTYVMGVPQDAAKIWAKIGAVTTGVNALVAVVVATVVYLAVRPALKHSNLLPQV